MQKWAVLNTGALDWKRSVQKIQNGKIISSSGYEGYSANVKFRGKDALVAAIFRKKEIFLFTLRSEDLQISNFVNEFNSIISSFRDLKRNELKLAESLKIKIYKVKKGDTYSSLSDKSPISYDQVRQEADGQRPGRRRGGP